MAEPKTKTAKLAQLLPQIEQGLHNGHTYEEIRKELAKAGLVLTQATFRQLLFKVRRRASSRPQSPLDVESVETSGLSASDLSKAEVAAPAPALRVGEPTQEETTKSSQIRMYHAPRKDRLTNRTPSMEDYL
jgi:hypothetical protein